jgi:hypothetical protein
MARGNLKLKILIWFSLAFIVIMTLIGILTISSAKQKVVEGAQEKLPPQRGLITGGPPTPPPGSALL